MDVSRKDLDHPGTTPVQPVPDLPALTVIDLPRRRANVAALRAKATSDDERWICDEFVRLFDVIDARTTAASALNTAVDAMWNDHDRVLSGRVREHHLAAITKAQSALAEALK
jgi:hypothetical protein